MLLQRKGMKECGLTKLMIYQSVRLPVWSGCDLKSSDRGSLALGLNGVKG